MKKTSLQLTLGLFIISSSAFAQQWNGSTTTSGDIYRDGNVGIGTTTPTGHLSFGNQGNHLTIGNPSFPNQLILSTGWLAGYGDYTELHVPGTEPNNVALFRMFNNGNVGIGTSIPTFNVHVVSSAMFLQKLEGTGNFSGIMLKSNAATKQCGIHFGSDGPSGVQTNSLRFARYSAIGNAQGSGFEANPVVLDMDAPDGSFMLNESGWIGIGTFLPNDRVEIAGNLRLSDGNADGPRIVWRGGANGAQEYRAKIAPDGYLAFFPGEGNPSTLTLTQDGKVGIGTQAPGSYKLAVEGKIGAREVQVTLTNPFPDYVFDSKYKLRSLFNLESYINENKHLPGVPSAAEVEKNGGVELGQMNAKLLEKVEELTLYIIEINKKVEKLEKENEALKKGN